MSWIGFALEQHFLVPSVEVRFLRLSGVATPQVERRVSETSSKTREAPHKIRQEQLTDSSSTVDSDNTTASPVNVEKLLKKFKTHRCAMDFDSSFCKAVFCEDITDDSGEIVSDTETSS